MKRFISSLVLTVGIFLALALPVSANHYWEIKMSEPSSTQQVRTFNVEYTALSTEAADQIKVDLIQNGSAVASQTTTKQYGDSGVFTVTVPSDGTYTFAMKATSNVDGDVQTTPTQTVNVTTPSSSTVSVVRTVPAATTAGTQGNAVAGTQTGGDTGQPTQGQVDSSAASTDSQNNAGVLGAETSANKRANAWKRAGIAALTALVLFAAYRFMRNKSRANLS